MSFSDPEEPAQLHDISLAQASYPLNKLLTAIRARLRTLHTHCAEIAKLTLNPDGMPKILAQQQIMARDHKDLRALLAQVEQLKTRIRLEDQEELQQMLAPLVGRHERLVEDMRATRRRMRGYANRHEITIEDSLGGSGYFDVAASLMESSADHAEQHGGGPAAASRAERHAAGQQQVQIHATPARIILPDGTPGPVLDMEYSDSDLAKMAQQEFLEMEQMIVDLNGLFRTVLTHVRSQGEQLTTVEQNVQRASTNVAAGKTDLRKANILQASSLPLTGALIGAVLGGPFGLVLGIKGGVALTTALGIGVGSMAGGLARRRIVEREKRALALEAASSR